MTLPEARNILEKYWEGESTLEEEEQLKHFFYTHSGDSLPADMQQAAELFSFYEEESGRTTEDIPLPEIEAEKKKQLLSSQRSWWKYAAAVILLLAGVSFYFYANQPAETSEQVTQITAQERLHAFKTTEKALKLMSGNLNKGKEEMQKLAIFDEVQHAITKH